MAHRDLQAKDSIKTLKRTMRSEGDANVRDRVRAILFALKGVTDREIGDKLGYSIQWVKKWVGRYKEGGLKGLQDGLRPGAPAALSNKQIMELYGLILEGPDPAGALSRYRISDIKELIYERFHAEYSISGTHALMKRMMLSHVKPRPSHPKNDPIEMGIWKKKPRNLSKKSEPRTRANGLKSGSKMKRGLAKRES